MREGGGVRGRELPSQGEEGRLLLSLLMALLLVFLLKSQISSRKGSHLLGICRGKDGAKEGGVALSGRRGRPLLTAAVVPTPSSVQHT